MAGPEGQAKPHSRSMLEFCRRLPKMELHAHLNGSLRGSTVRELAEIKGLASDMGPSAVERLTATGVTRTLAETFALFDLIHKVTTDHETITRITREVLEDLRDDGVIYAELRTTPKADASRGMDKESYMQAVFEGADAFFSSRDARDSHPFVIRWLLSINRRDSAAEAEETVDLALSLRDGGRGVVGVDLSGNPSVGAWSTWEPALRRARQSGLAVVLHAAEVWNPEETRAMLRFGPSRVGHMCCLDEAGEAELLASRIPLELCLTSNVATASVGSYAEHHITSFRAAGHPLALCTDDSGVFDTALSMEYAVAAEVFDLSREEVVRMAGKAIAYAALEAEEVTRAMLRSHFKAAAELLLKERQN